MYEQAIHQPLPAQEPLVPNGTESCAFVHMPEVMVGLIFRSMNSKHETERSYVRIPLRQRLQPGMQHRQFFPFCTVS